MNQMSLSPQMLPGSYPEAVMSPRRARALAAERPRPFLVDRRDEEALPQALAGALGSGTLETSKSSAVRLVFGGFAKRPVFVAGVVGLVGVTGIGLFLGLMLGELLS